MFMKYSDRDDFGRLNKYRSLGAAGLLKAYNDANSKLFLDSSLSDSAKGNGTPLTITNSGVSLNGSNNLDFSSGDYLTINKADINGAFAAGNEWFIDMWIYPTSSQTFATLLGAEDNGARSDITGLCIHGGTRLYVYYGSWITDGTFLSDAGSISINSWQHVRVEKWLDGAQWKCTIFIDGVPTSTIDVSDTAMYSTSEFGIAYTGSSDRRFVGQMNKFMVKSVAGSKGVAFTPESRT